VGVELAPPLLDSEGLGVRYEDLAREACPIVKSPWRFNRPADNTQGWKLHISATILSAGDVLDRARAVLDRAGVAYKCTETLGVVALLNTGLPSYSQTGKFITVYCRNADEAVGLAAELDAATAGLPGPEAPFDLPYRRGGLVYYRYGSFSAHTVRDPQGRWRADRREAGFAVPSWIKNPFPEAEPPNDSDGPLGLTYLVTRALAQRGKGGVYEALDLDASPARLVILKEGRPHGETQWDGTDGFWRIGYEAAVLRDLRAHDVSVPDVLAEFSQGGNHYVVLEKIAGAPLLDRNPRRTRRLTWRETRAVSNRLDEILDRIHAAGWVWRDCKPDNLLCEGDRLRPIDFEGACPTHQTEVVPWGTFAYTPRAIAEGERRTSGWLEDDFSAAAVLFRLGTGAPPDPEAQDRTARLARSRCPAEMLAYREQALAGGVAAVGIATALQHAKRWAAKAAAA
jgi:hypothetical protein